MVDQPYLALNSVIDDSYGNVIILLALVGPPLPKHVLHPPHVGGELLVYLLGPDDGAGHRGNLASLGLNVLLLKLLMQSLCHS